MAHFPQDIMSLIHLRNLRNSVKSGRLKMTYVTSGHVNSGIRLTVPRQMFYSLFLNSPGYKSTLRAFCLHACHCAGQKNSLGYRWAWNCVLASHPKPAHFIWTTHTSCTCKVWTGGCSQNRISHKTFFIACWVVKIMSSCFCGILAVTLLVLARTDELQRRAYFK